MPKDDSVPKRDGNESNRPPPVGHRPDGNGATLELADAFELVNDARRQAVLVELYECPREVVPLERLAAQVAETELLVAGSGSEGPADHEQRIAISLHHVHLPKLASAGVIAYDTDERTCRYRGNETLESILNAAGERDRQQ